jgi:hypothetical protein
MSIMSSAPALPAPAPFFVALPAHADVEKSFAACTLVLVRPFSLSLLCPPARRPPYLTRLFHSCCRLADAQPFLAVGNVGCLAVDALLATHSASLVHVGYLDGTRFVLPAVGNDALALRKRDLCGRVHLPLEVFFAADMRLVVVQQRAPVMPHARAAFAERMIDFIVAAGFARTLLLSSRHASSRVDSQMAGCGLFCLVLMMIERVESDGCV